MKITKELRNKILFTLAMLVVYHFGTVLAVPGVMRITSLGSGSLWSIMNLLNGGALERMSIFALGVGPYITAGIIIQLLSNDIIPYLSDLKNQGKKGQEKIERVTRYLTIVLAIIQAYGVVKLLNRQYGIIEDQSLSNILFIMTVLIAGSQTLVWLGDRITAKGIGNGVSFIIFAGIVQSIPSNIMQTFSILVNGEGQQLMNGIITFIACILLYLLIIVCVVIVQLAVRKIPVKYSSSKVSTQNNMTFIPIKLNTASVIPVIFASSIIGGIQTLISYINYDWYLKLSEILSFEKFLGLLIYALLILFFSFFYTDTLLNPNDMAERLSKQNAFIPGVRAGHETQAYLKEIIKRMTLFGAIGLMIIALIPYVLPVISPIPSTMALGGTGIIIVVGVAMETISTIQTEALSKKYKGFV